MQPPIEPSQDARSRAKCRGRHQERDAESQRVEDKQQRSPLDSPCPAAIVRIPPRIGVRHGDHPAPNETPMMNDDATVPGVPGLRFRARAIEERNLDQVGLIETKDDQEYTTEANEPGPVQDTRSSAVATVPAAPTAAPRATNTSEKPST